MEGGSLEEDEQRGNSEVKIRRRSPDRRCSSALAQFHSVAM